MLYPQVTEHTAGDLLVCPHSCISHTLTSLTGHRRLCPGAHGPRGEIRLQLQLRLLQVQLSEADQSKAELCHGLLGLGHVLFAAPLENRVACNLS